MVVDPLPDFLDCRTTLAIAVGTMPSGAAVGAVYKVLVVCDALV